VTEKRGKARVGAVLINAQLLPDIGVCCVLHYLLHSVGIRSIAELTANNLCSSGKKSGLEVSSPR
jgi:hypothetical protein